MSIMNRYFVSYVLLFITIVKEAFSSSKKTRKLIFNLAVITQCVSPSGPTIFSSLEGYSTIRIDGSNFPVYNSLIF